MKNFFPFFAIILLVKTNSAVASRRKGSLFDWTNEVSSDADDDWSGKWFPTITKPNKQQQKLEPHKQSKNVNRIIYDKTCDGDSDNVNIDFDPADKIHSYNYLCFTSNHTKYTPNLETEAVLVEHFIPPAYNALVKCLNESIEYMENPPTYGSYRLLPAKYGSYKYLPPQRWLHNLAEGAIVMLYHPCAFPGQVKQLETIVKSCLYRHIITPSQDLEPERPLALLAWGKYLKLSVIDEGMVINFIKKNAKQGVINDNESFKNPKATLYSAGLIDEAHLVTDLDDSEMCGYKEM